MDKERQDRYDREILRLLLHREDRPKEWIEADAYANWWLVYVVWIGVLQVAITLYYIW